MSARSDATQLWLSLSCSGAEIIAQNRSEIVLGAAVESVLSRFGHPCCFDA